MYDGKTTISYFPFTSFVLKSLQLKIAIVYNYEHESFDVWLAGRNRQVQKQFWDIIRKGWNKYQIPASIERSFAIVESAIADKPVFSFPSELTELIEHSVIAQISPLPLKSMYNLL